MSKWKFRLSPTRTLFLGFFIIIMIGSLLLSLPISSADGNRISYIDSLFTATSAMTLTGLTVLNIGSQFSLFGQIILLVLIQIGGLGFMTFAVLFALLLGKRIGLRSRLLIQEATRAVSTRGMVRLVQQIILVSFSLELLATLILTLHWKTEYGWDSAFYKAIFHSIAAFNNAGFSLWPNSLIDHVNDPVVILLIAFLSLIGGLGFFVISDFWNKRRWLTLSLHSKIVLSGSLFLTIVGFIIVFMFEYKNPNTLGQLDHADKVFAAFFQGVVPRSSGFNSLETQALEPSTQLIMIVLMFIGAGSGSTGGGIKITTATILLLAVWTIVRGRQDVQIFHRRISSQNVMQALVVIVISIGLIILLTLALTLTEENKNFLQILFEATSAASTVGLSMGLTPELSNAGKVMIACAMFIGKLGTLSAAYALANRSYPSKFRYPEEKVMIG